MAVCEREVKKETGNRGQKEKNRCEASSIKKFLKGAWGKLSPESCPQNQPPQKSCKPQKTQQLAPPPFRFHFHRKKTEFTIIKTNWKQNRKLPLRYVILGIAVTLIIFLKVGPVFCVDSEIPKKPIPLSGEAAKIVAWHLGEVMKQLRDGGPPLWHTYEHKKEKMAGWSIEEEISEYKSVVTSDYPNGYTSKHYLDDYRRTFIAAWDHTFRCAVKLDADGTATIDHSWTLLSPFQAPGMTNGFYDGRQLADKLIQQAKHNEVEAKYNPNVRLDHNSREAVIYIRKNIIGISAPNYTGLSNVFVMPEPVLEESLQGHCPEN